MAGMVFHPRTSSGYRMRRRSHDLCVSEEAVQRGRLPALCWLDLISRLAEARATMVPHHLGLLSRRLDSQPGFHRPWEHMRNQRSSLRLAAFCARRPSLILDMHQAQRQHLAICFSKCCPCVGFRLSFPLQRRNLKGTTYAKGPWLDRISEPFCFANVDEALPDQPDLHRGRLCSSDHDG